MTSKLFGISVYLQDLSEEYIRSASENGARYIFTSLHIPEEDLSRATEQLDELITYCHQYNMLLVPDVSPVTFEKLKIPAGDFKELKEMGIKAIRLDYGFDDIDRIKSLQEDFEIILNASTLNETFITEALAYGVDLQRIIAIHNFYPKNETGLSLQSVKLMNEIFLKYEIPVMAFVTGDALKRFPLFEGLPTVESHRTKHPYVATVELIECTNSSGVMIGDSQAYASTLRFIRDYLQNKVITLPIYLDKRYHDLFSQTLTSRRDVSEKIVRLTTPRCSGIRPENNGDRQFGDIILLNDLSNRYGGEIQLCKMSLPFYSGGNKIGFVHPDFKELLHFIDGSHVIKFVPLEVLD
ncbi:MupG family TIM beta-alpha barrel fold protein [Vagococcus zengguangii]|uniref:DUF871 domain-containing protein n=1 Tax=Vagococcus zengguangii TaxID=2571750 RepID=A0A4D7CU40_9ENTE|nr:MupG family TIM beta-alpha barrel fold protein [Vagococcus zengguangii]QCI85786.1 DUF871 domain-containing protein [Vagococcus zengguangii]TLG81727.1 DUF871 domain-containing protein [Vagococcus zengguangii]